MLLALRILSCVIYGLTGFFLIFVIWAFMTSDTDPSQISDNTASLLLIVSFISAVPFAYLGFRIHTYWKTTLSKVLIIGFPILVQIVGFIPQHPAPNPAPLSAWPAAHSAGFGWRAPFQSNPVASEICYQRSVWILA